MARSICQSLLDMLAEAGAREIFGMTGDVINPLLEAIRNDDRFRWIGVRLEEHAAYAAAAHSEITGKIGIRLAAVAPPPTNLPAMSPGAL